MTLARRYAPGVALIANGRVQDSPTVEQTLHAGADIIAVGKAALANPDLVQQLLAGRAPEPFDPSLLAPIAHIKDLELR